jgi:hypothetical protein
MQSEGASMPDLSLCDKLKKLLAENKTGVEIHFLDGHIIPLFPELYPEIEVGLDYIVLPATAADAPPNIIPFSSIKLILG